MVGTAIGDFVPSVEGLCDLNFVGAGVTLFAGCNDGFELSDDVGEIVGCIELAIVGDDEFCFDSVGVDVG